MDDLLVENYETDVTVIGGGGAGLAAALSASENGCKNIIVLEKAGIGGNSSLAHDVFGTESPVQKRMGVDARKDDFFRIAMNWAHWSKINPRVIRAFIDKSGDTIRWLEEKGLQFELGQYYVNQSPLVRHTIAGEGAHLMKVLKKLCEDVGVRLLTQSAAKKIVRDGNGSVTGVIAESKDTKIVLKTKSVILATGGYGANPDFLKMSPYYNPDTMVNHGVRGNKGDGIVMATEIGAATAGIGNIMFHGPSAPRSAASLMKLDDSEYPVSILIREPETMWLNKLGKRFIDEGHNLSSFASAGPAAQQPGGVMFTVFDDRTRQIMEEEGIIWPGAYGGQKRETKKHTRPNVGEALPGLGRELRILQEKGVALKITDSLEELAAFIGAKPEVLKNSIEEYNASCANGHDAVFCKDRRYLLPMSKPPYYAIRGAAGICDAIGGVKINEHMEVVDHEENAIPGLFAAGSTTGGWETDNYCYELTGHLLGFALNSGRIAGENVAKYLR